MRSEGFPFIVWGSGGWTLVRVVLLVSSRCRRGRVANSVAIERCNSACLERACVWTFRVAARARRWIEGWRVAWQAWDAGCTWAFGRMLGGGFASQVR